MLSNKKALYQVKLILECLPQEEYKLIPKETLEYIENNLEYDENIYINPNIELEKQNIDEKTYRFLNQIVKKVDLDKQSNKKDEIKEYVKNIKKSNEQYNSKIENIKLKNIIKTLENENKKIPKAKELVKEYKKVVKQKDDKILKLQDINNYLNQEMKKIPKIIRNIFIKEIKIKSIKI